MFSKTFGGTLRTDKNNVSLKLVRNNNKSVLNFFQNVEKVAKVVSYLHGVMIFLNSLEISTLWFNKYTYKVMFHMRRETDNKIKEIFKSKM